LCKLVGDLIDHTQSETFSQVVISCIIDGTIATSYESLFQVVYYPQELDHSILPEGHIFEGLWCVSFYTVQQNQVLKSNSLQISQSTTELRYKPSNQVNLLRISELSEVSLNQALLLGIALSFYLVIVKVLSCSLGCKSIINFVC
jgi:hypothetical protein